MTVADDHTTFDTSNEDCTSLQPIDTDPGWIVFKLDKPYFIEKILIVGEQVPSWHLSDVDIIVDAEYSRDPTKLCSGATLLPRGSSTTHGTEYSSSSPWLGTEWFGGVESDCNLMGDHITMTRPASAPAVSQFTICTFGAIANPRYARIGSIADNSRISIMEGL